MCIILFAFILKNLAAARLFEKIAHSCRMNAQLELHFKHVKQTIHFHFQFSFVNDSISMEWISIESLMPVVSISSQRRTTKNMNNNYKMQRNYWLIITSKEQILWKNYLYTTFDFCDAGWQHSFIRCYAFFNRCCIFAVCTQFVCTILFIEICWWHMKICCCWKNKMTIEKINVFVLPFFRKFQ